MGAPPTLSCVLLSMGDRPAELARAVASVRVQDGPAVEVLVVANGAEVDAPPGARVLRLPANVGIPAGRNAGVAATRGDVVLFLDDDGEYADRGVAERLRRQFVADPRLGVVSLRVEDPAGGPGARRHVPRLRAGDPLRSSDVTTFLGGACAVRREVFQRCGGLPEAFFFPHEETDLAWRALDAGYRIRYDAESVVRHPAASSVGRLGPYDRLTGRNRVWLARRNLPAPLVPVYLATWAVLTTARERPAARQRAWWAGFAEGWRTDPGPRRPMRWRTVVRMTRLGRPPVV